MDNRLRHLTDLIHQAIEEATKTTREQEKDEHRRRECEKLIRKLREEIAAEQRELDAEKKKAAALSTRSRKLERDMQSWQQKLDDFVSQTKQIKSDYVGKIGADVMDTAMESYDSVVIAALPVVQTDLSLVLPDHIPEHDCAMWAADFANKCDFRDPKMLPPMDSLICCNGHAGSPNRKKGRRGSPKKRKLSVSGSESEGAPKKRTVRKRIVDADGTAAKLSSEFKRECMAILSASESPSSGSDERGVGNGAEAAKNWQEVDELAVIVSPHPGQPVDLRCASHTFRPESIVTIPRRFNLKDFESKMKLIQSCTNMRIFCMFGLDHRLEKLARDSLTLSLAESCPKIEHFILDDALLDIAIAYQEVLPNNIQVVEIKNGTETEDEVVHLITSSSKVRSVYLKHCSVNMIEKIVPRVKSLSLCWITDHEFKSLVKCGSKSQISELMLETVHLTMDAVRIGQLAAALPHVHFLKLSGPLEHIHCLRLFKCLRHVVFDAECQSSQPIDPNFPIDMSRALEMSRQQDEGSELLQVKQEEDEEDVSQQILSSQIGLNNFFSSCGPTLTSFSITIREKFKKDFFHHLRKSCPVLKELTILSTIDQYFEPKSLSLPSLQRLSLQFINMNDAKLIEVLDCCRNLIYISIDKPRKITRSCINVLRFYGLEVFSKRQVTPGAEKFTAIILTEGREEISKHLIDEATDITFKQKAVAEISSRLRYKY